MPSAIESAKTTENAVLRRFTFFLLTRKLVFDDCVRFVHCTLHNFSQRTHIFLFSLP